MELKGGMASKCLMKFMIFFFAAATWKMDFFRNPKAGTRGIQHVRRMEIEFQFIKKKLEEQEEETFSLELHVCTSAASIRL